MTVAFVAPDEPHPLERIEPRPTRFETLELWVGPQHDVFPLQPGGEEASPCQVTQAAESAGGSVAPAALAAVVQDWLARARTTLPGEPVEARPRWLHEELDDLHTRLLAAHLATPTRGASALGPEAALVERARRIRSVETDLGLILGRVEADLTRAAPDVDAAQVGDLLEEALRPLSTWAAATDESSY